ncbi:MAG: DUF4271 domain-containing protein [Bacteroidales bacterium]|nr:DUF4271 domain-containing protein [Bacteroidales bacterium]MDD4820962.1 DUF4271 domain-containing protein [Bacteroidales bacterium]
MNADNPFFTWDYDSLMHYQPAFLEREATGKVCVASVETQKGTPARQILRDSDSIALFFSISCTLLLITFFQRQNFLAHLFQNVFRVKSRGVTFEENNLSDLHTNLQLLPLTILMLCLLCFYSINGNSLNIGEAKIILILLLFILSFALFYTLKFLLFRFIAYIFFDDTRSSKWQNSYLSNIALLGTLFCPILLVSVYSDLYSNVLLIVLGGLFLFFRILLLQKVFIIFIPKINTLLYLFLYLCTVEILPAVLMYEGLVSIYELVIYH